jgi:hypothetical protein
MKKNCFDHNNTHSDKCHSHNKIYILQRHPARVIQPGIPGPCTPLVLPLGQG